MAAEPNVPVLKGPGALALAEVVLPPPQARHMASKHTESSKEKANHIEEG